MVRRRSRTERSLYAKDQKVRGEAVQDHGDGKTDAAYAGLSPSARRQEHKVEATRDPRQTGGSRSHASAAAVSAVWSLSSSNRDARLWPTAWSPGVHSAR